MTSPFGGSRNQLLLLKFKEDVRMECPQNIHNMRKVLRDAGIADSITNRIMLDALEEMVFEYEAPEFDVEYHHTDCQCEKCRINHG